MTNLLINKYNVAGPRYTSYPTVPYWDEPSFSVKKWESSLKQSFQESNISEGISLYIHLPFCESLCTFCGCNKRITTRHEVESPYINYVLKEWQLYVAILGSKPRIKELHLGGGTPTFFSPKNLEKLIDGIFSNAEKAENHEFSFEGHPNNTTEAHLKTLYNLGFRRVSYGVQDYNDVVQKAIHRIQPFENVKRVTELAREIGYTSISHDIIFGLPFQTEAHVANTIARTKELMPDRIAFYSYAHVPWIKGNGQRGFKDSDLPSAESKRKQYELGKSELDACGFVEIGMDHFALKSDNLYQATETKALHRNFMGYTSSKTQMMIGLGVSAISDSWYGFAQNEKKLEDYYKRLDTDEIPVIKGHILSTEDLIIRRHILNLMCHFETSWTETDNYFKELPDVLVQLEELEQDGLIQMEPSTIKVTEAGRPYVRNVCMAFDLLLQRKQPESQLFSMTI
ncbi:oxygen-independent coproporphyrinogen III oxidase [Bizionia myxarmorum]|uniref:Coproporphyrinogen-III oxidase n=1 Tax=Bizionia myxarmorum TaxID=291186 RepID=A0A5D0R8Y0_9FLAO|nr:oxygen-independent coproporphyrinogen III oxidase [Bizionia myxarmorum]TYB77138.1 oxygen-independent coproporphyrinogen III oxidase [Bizionia myxarmorum]